MPFRRGMFILGEKRSGFDFANAEEVPCGLTDEGCLDPVTKISTDTTSPMASKGESEPRVSYFDASLSAFFWLGSPTKIENFLPGGVRMLWLAPMNAAE
eukprot:1303881-Amorphochlora_amoeboformis.AAC.1